MLEEHFKNIEESLLAQAGVQETTGHNLHKGTPREFFIRDFLEKHLPQNISIGTGEIIDSKTKLKSRRNQYDIILYKSNYPKLNVGGNIDCFLIESVLCTIEVKSTLTKKDLKQAIRAANNAKKLTPNFQRIVGLYQGWTPHSIMNFIVAYKCDRDIITVYKWIKEIHKVLHIEHPCWGFEDRYKAKNNTIDGIFVLKNKMLFLDNTPFTVYASENNYHQYVISNSIGKSLLVLFIKLLDITSLEQNSIINPAEYIKGMQLNIETDFAQ